MPVARVHPPVAVAYSGGAYRVVAARPALPGDLLLRIAGVLTHAPSRHSLQVGPGRHLVPPPGLAPDDPSPRYAWRYLNHSCDPNAVVSGRELIATRPVAAGDEVTFDYNTTEGELAEPFACRCGHCGGRTIRGRDTPPKSAP